jgi:hypothetical protein
VDEPDFMPQVGETVGMAGHWYQCTNVYWDPEEDEITVTYQRKWPGESEQPANLTVVGPWSAPKDEPQP